MTKQRFQALAQVEGRKPLNVQTPSGKVSEYFASNVFTWKEMRGYLPPNVYDALRDCVDKGGSISRSTADQVASAMKAWSLQLGATHYTHWFQPITGATAEKHDSFFNLDETTKLKY